MHVHIRRTAAAIAAAAFQIYAIAGYYAWKLPDRYYVTAEHTLSLPSALPITAQHKDADALAAFYAQPTDTETVSLRLFGIIPIKNAEVQTVDAPMLIPGGQPFGIKLRMDGVMVIRLGAVQTNFGSSCPAEDAGLLPGDIIHTVNGYPITSNAVLSETIKATEGASAEVIFTRNEETYTAELTPVFSAAENAYAAGVWVRDSLAGVGTMTFINPENGTFAGLGHPICDSETGTCIPIGEGTACPITISSITKGKAGKPGMLEGTFLSSGSSGVLTRNNHCGVFGTLNHSISAEEAVPMGFKQDIQPGKAEILCTINGTEPERYTIIIEEINYNNSESTKNMIVRITDERLLEQTGGIVQGMSGSPILQDGRLIGAVTHVFVDDPTRGYGIFAENMYAFSGN